MISSKINIGGIISDNLDTYRNQDGKFSNIDKFWFTAVPLVVGLVFYVIFAIRSSSDSDFSRIDSAVLSAFSVFSALLLNLQMLVYSKKQGEYRKINQNEAQEEYQNLRSIHDSKTKYIEQIFNNLSYMILLSIIIITLSLFSIIFLDSTVIFVVAITIVLICNFLVNLFMCLKRMHLLFHT